MKTYRALFAASALLSIALTAHAATDVAAKAAIQMLSYDITLSDHGVQQQRMQVQGRPGTPISYSSTGSGASSHCDSASVQIFPGASFVPAPPVMPIQFMNGGFNARLNEGTSIALFPVAYPDGSVKTLINASITTSKTGKTLDVMRCTVTSGRATTETLVDVLDLGAGDSKTIELEAGRQLKVKLVAIDHAQ